MCPISKCIFENEFCEQDVVILWDIFRKFAFEHVFNAGQHIEVVIVLPDLWEFCVLLCTSKYEFNANSRFQL